MDNDSINNKKKPAMPSSEIQKEKLSALYKLSALDIRPGAVCKAKCVITGLSAIQKSKHDPILEEAVHEASIDFNDIMIFNGVAYDHCSAKVYLEFIAGDHLVYYSYSDHGPFSIPFGQMLERVVESGDAKIMI